VRLFFHLSYKGNLYRGWQKQKNNDACIQEIVEKAIRKVTKIQVSLIGCGRTDAGVHASCFYAHANVEDEHGQKIIDLCEIINYCLPLDIVMHDIYPSEHHARFNAFSRRYRYKMHFTHNAFINELSAYYPDKNLDIDAIKSACEVILRQEEFYNFCKTPDRQENTLCKIRSCSFDYDPVTQQADFVIEANRFVKSMIRVIVHRLLEVGRGIMTVEQFEKMFDRSTKQEITKLAKPQGLYLEDIKYSNRGIFAE
jgi:tRNA pseudouridine38-40 synthase